MSNNHGSNAGWRHKRPGRFVVVGVSVLLVLVTALALVGCGGNTKQTQQYMKQGDQLMSQVIESTRQFKVKLPFATGESAGTSGPQSARAQLQASAQVILKKAQEANAYYSKIRSFKDVSDYYSYANARMGELEGYTKMISRVISIVSSDQNYSFSDCLHVMEGYTNVITRLDQEADKIKNEKKL